MRQAIEWTLIPPGALPRIANTLRFPFTKRTRIGCSYFPRYGIATHLIRQPLGGTREGKGRLVGCPTLIAHQTRVGQDNAFIRHLRIQQMRNQSPANGLPAFRAEPTSCGKILFWLIMRWRCSRSLFRRKNLLFFSQSESRILPPFKSKLFFLSLLVETIWSEYHDVMIGPFGDQGAPRCRNE